MTRLDRIRDRLLKYARSEFTYDLKNLVDSAPHISPGDTTYLGALADHMEEIDHPLAPLVRHLFNSGLTPSWKTTTPDGWYGGATAHRFNYGIYTDSWPHYYHYDGQKIGSTRHISLLVEPNRDENRHRVTLRLHSGVAPTLDEESVYRTYLPTEAVSELGDRLAATDTQFDKSGTRFRDHFNETIGHIRGERPAEYARPRRYAARVSAPRPWTKFTGEKGFTHEYSDDLGNSGIIQVIPRNDTEDQILHVDWIGPRGVSPGEVAHTSKEGNIRHIAAQMAQHYPDAVFLSGIRTGGAHAEENVRKTIRIPGRLTAEEKRQGLTKPARKRPPIEGVQPAVQEPVKPLSPIKRIGTASSVVFPKGRLPRRVVRYAAHTHQDFVAKIAENHEDMTPSLVFADWLGDNGHTGSEHVVRHSIKHLQRGPIFYEPNSAVLNRVMRDVRLPLDHAAPFIHLGRWGTNPNGPGKSPSTHWLLNLYYPHPEGGFVRYGYGGGTDDIRQVLSGMTDVPNVDSEIQRMSLDHEKMSRRGLPRRLAKIDGHQPAHRLFAHFPIEFALRALANDPANHSDIRNLARVALTGGDKGLDGPGVPESLWGLADALEENNHPAKDWYSWRSAADKSVLDQHTYRALTEAAEDTRRTTVNPQNFQDWAFTPEAHAQRAASAISYTGYQNNLLYQRDKTLLERVRNRVSQLMPEASQEHIDESLRRHRVRAHNLWIEKNGTEEDIANRRARGIGPAVTHSKATAKTDLAKEDKATRYRRRYALNARGDFIDSLRRVRSHQQNQLRKAAEQVSDRLGLRPTHVYDALHDSPQGAVPGLASAIYSPTASPEAIQAAAAYLAMINNATGFGVFHVRPNGVDLLHRFRHAGSGLQLRQRLDRAGLTNRVLIPHRQGFDVILPDPKGQLRSRVRDFTKQAGVELQTSPGFFSVVGDADQSRAREMFRGEVAKMARQQPTYPAVVYHAAHALDNPLDSTSILTLSDHLNDVYPDNPVVQSFANWVQGGDFDTVMRNMKFSKYTAYGPTEDDNSVEMKPSHRDGRLILSEDLTPEDRAIPIFRRIYGQPLWERRAYRKNLGYLTVNNLEATIPLRRKGATSAEVANALLTHGGPESLIHAIIGVRHWHPERNPDNTGSRGKVEFSRGTVRRYATVSEETMNRNWQTAANKRKAQVNAATRRYIDKKRSRPVPELAQQIASHLTTNGPTNRKTLTDKFRLDSATLDAALAHAVDAGHIEQTVMPEGRNVVGRPGTWYKAKGV